MDIPTKQYTYIQDLIVDTVKAVTQLDATVHIAVLYKEISQITVTQLDTTVHSAVLYKEISQITVTQLDTTVHSAVLYKEISQIKHNKHFTQKTIKYNKQIRRKLIKIIITKADESRTVVVIDKDV